MKDKYWFISYLRIRPDGQVCVEQDITKIHPLKFINDNNNMAGSDKFLLTFYKRVKKKDLPPQFKFVSVLYGSVQPIKV